jgi:hypothetical protein
MCGWYEICGKYSFIILDLFLKICQLYHRQVVKMDTSETNLRGNGNQELTTRGNSSVDSGVCACKPYRFRVITVTFFNFSNKS